MVPGEVEQDLVLGREGHLGLSRCDSALSCKLSSAVFR